LEVHVLILPHPGVPRVLTHIRVMKARRTRGRCPLCRRLLAKGEWICRIGWTWVHRDCWLERRRQGAP
jgi:hypothetical protein